jgi:hypothetical protein
LNLQNEEVKGHNMLHIRSAPVAGVSGLRAALQGAIRLEHATIPPYLTAYYTLSGTSSSVNHARRVLKNIVLEEMLHMNLMCNVLNAIGGAPEINRPDFVPSYPGPLPMGIAEELTIHIKRFSLAVVKDVFMRIEEPEMPLNLPVKQLAFDVAGFGTRTIGEFYAEIRREVELLGDAIFTGDPRRQVTGYFGSDEDITVKDVETARHAISVIVEQGEGNPKSPVDFQKDIAHYYRFEELAVGMRIVEDLNSPLNYSFDSNQPIVIDDAKDVVQMVDDPQIIDLSAEDEKIARLSNVCDAIYSRMLLELHNGFNGSPNIIDSAVYTSMSEFAGATKELLRQPLTSGPHAGLFAGPRFLYKP